MAHRLLPKDEQEARDLRIVRMVELGVLYSDIGRAVGLSGGTITTILKRRKNAGKTSCSVGSGGRRGFECLDAVDGLPV